MNKIIDSNKETPFNNMRIFFANNYDIAREEITITLDRLTLCEIKDCMYEAFEYKNRCKDAIEYINKLIFVSEKEKKYLEDTHNGKIYMYKVNYVQDILDILRGIKDDKQN